MAGCAFTPAMSSSGRTLAGGERVDADHDADGHRVEVGVEEATAGDAPG